MRSPLTLAALLLLALSARAGEDDEEGDSKPPSVEPEAIDLGIDDIMNDIDLGPSTRQESVTYEGSLDQQGLKYVAGKPVAIAHSGGNIRVRCAEREGITARVAYSLRGTNTANMERYGKGIGLAVYGGATSGSVKTRMPSRPSGIDSFDVELTVNLPKKAAVTVTGGDGWVQVVGCEGSVKVSSRSGGAYVEGTLTSFAVSSTGGDVKVELSDDSKLAGTSSVSAAGGDAELDLPMSYGGKLTARGSSVRVAHNVAGTNTDTLVQGTVGSGNASLTVSAKGAVVIKSP